MNLDTILEIFGKTIPIVTKRIEERRIVPLDRHPLADTREDIGAYIIGQPKMENVLSELRQIGISPDQENVMAYGKAVYTELYERLNGDKHKDIEGIIIDILRPFMEYSYSMFPDTLCQRIINVFEGATNESCIKYFHNPTPKIMANAKAIVIEDEKKDAMARGRYFEDYIGDILSKDIVIKTASYVHYYVQEFAVMLDCVLLKNGHDLLELQSLHNIKLIDTHKEVLLAHYIGSDGYAKQLLSKVRQEAKSLKLPIEIDTDRARKYFARAINLGYITYSDTGLKWNDGRRGSLAQLGYFILKVYCPNNTGQIPEQSINNLFGVNRIGSAVTQLNNAKKPQKWRKEIDNKIFYD